VGQELMEVEVSELIGLRISRSEVSRIGGLPDEQVQAFAAASPRGLLPLPSPWIA
jgi:hypothetical protein